MRAEQFAALFACVTLLAAALCVRGAIRSTLKGTSVGIVAAAVCDAAFLIVVNGLAPGRIMPHLREVIVSLALATFVPALVFVIGHRSVSSTAGKRVAGAIAVVVWAVMTAYLGYFLGCDLDTECY